MRVTVDTNVLCRSLTSPDGPARRLVRLLLDRPHSLVLSDPILYEFEEVLSYPWVGRGNEVPLDEAVAYLAMLEYGAEIVALGNWMLLPLADVDDWAILRTAVAGKSDVICTLDRGFFDIRCLSYCQARGIRVMTDVELLRELTV